MRLGLTISLKFSHRNKETALETIGSPDVPPGVRPMPPLSIGAFFALQQARRVPQDNLVPRAGAYSVGTCRRR